MLKKTYLTITAAALTCLSLSLNAFASAVSEAEEPYFSAAQQPIITTQPPYDPAVPSTDTELAEETIEAVEPVIEPIAAPVPNETAPADNSDFLSNYYTGTGDIENILEYWELNGYPEDVSYVANNSMAEYHVATQTEVIHYLWEIGVVNADEARKQEICALISSEHHIRFEDCEYSHEYRVRVKDEIESIYPQAAAELENSRHILVYLDKYPEEEKDVIENEIYQKYNTGSLELVFVLKTDPTIGVPETVIAIGIEPETEIAAEIGVDAVGADNTAVESNVDVPSNVNGISSDASPVTNDIAIPEAQTFGGNHAENDTIPQAADAANNANASQKAEYAAEEEGIGEVAAIISETGKKESSGLWIWLCSAAAAVVAITAAVIIGKAKHTDSLSLADGGEVSVNGKVSKAEIVKSVRESGIEPSESAFDGIMEKIKGEEK